ncbi:MAG TPA: anion transporter [Candidatus Aquabacterium excrementipullorum]|nr:anion transporter [Candidatus Aquabacterium excrementipullorum]
MNPGKIARYPQLVDWPTIASLTGLLLLTKGLEISGALHWLGLKIVRIMATERAVALSLVATAALLSTVLTNDVALFVVIPLTLGVCRLAGMASTKLIVFEALAVNVGSALTPIGNPQNIFLWQRSGVSFVDFVLHMLPLVALMMAALLLLTGCVFGPRQVQSPDQLLREPLDTRLILLSVTLFPLFLVAVDLHYPGAAACALLAVFLILRPRMVSQLDWGLLLVFILMFIDLRLLTDTEAIKNMFQRLGLTQPLHLYFAGVGFSQFISNVPAAIALAEYSDNWRVMAYGVNVGGFGLMIGSLANLIALRLSGDRKAWMAFHLYAIPALAVATIMGYLLLGST